MSSSVLKKKAGIPIIFSVYEDKREGIIKTFFDALVLDPAILSTTNPLFSPIGLVILSLTSLSNSVIVSCILLSALEVDSMENKLIGIIPKLWPRELPIPLVFVVPEVYALSSEVISIWGSKAGSK